MKAHPVKAFRRGNQGSRTARSSVTGDLFADGGKFVAGVAPSLTVMPPVRNVAAPRIRHLWYAAVFPSLSEDLALPKLERLSLFAQHFTSFVSIEMPNALLMEIRGSVKLFGSFDALHTAIDAAWSRLEIPVQVATAPTTMGALWLARANRHVRLDDPGSLAGAMAELPVSCTLWNPQRLQTLQSMGVLRIGELLRLPRAGVARRFGPEALRDLDVAVGKQAAPRRMFVPLERFRERADFDTEIETVAYLQEAAKPLIAHCTQFLRKRQAGIQTLQLTLRHRVLPVTRVRLGLAGITGEQRRLMDVLDQKLNRLELRAPVRGMELKSGTLQPLSASSLDAFAGLRSGGRDTVPQLVERLRARLGDGAVYGLVSIAEHRPEAAWRRVNVLTSTDSRLNEVSESADQDFMQRPVWLLAQPVSFSACDLQQLRRGELILEQGPERIESGWWDGKGVARDYYVARRVRGPRWWIFQERLTRDWFLHGVFA